MIKLEHVVLASPEQMEFIIEGMRNPNYILYVIPNVLGISQLVAILFMIAAVSAFVVLQVKAKKDNEI